jgi:glucose-1-phosphate cytidylyltransferase
MKCVILAGGLGTRLREETEFKPKPMVEIGGIPIIWHIMKHLSHFGINEFVICLGYKGYLIKEYFLNFENWNNNIQIKLGKYKDVEILSKFSNDNWDISLIDTGLESNTALRLKKIEKFIGDERLLVTYGDGLSDVDINKLIEFHKSHSKLATLTAVQPVSRFGSISLSNNQMITEFKEKQKIDDWVNGGLFIFEPEVFNYLNSDEPLEHGPINKLVEDKEIYAYKHLGFWQPMDTYRETLLLNEIWNQNRAPWKNWD